MNKVDIIICTHNNEDIISRCLDSVKKQTFKDFNCILADDCSQDNTVSIVKRTYPWVKIIKKDRQTGPAMSRNTAIERTRSDFIATMDSDAQLHRDWLKEQLKVMHTDESIGIAASKIVYSWNKRRINSCGGSMIKEGFGFDLLSGADAEKQKFFLRPVLYGHSAAMLIRRKMLQEIGVFDSAYFYGNEDTDIGWRANIAGWKVIFNPNAVAYHE
ncbi:MAG: glycosyltransferase family 2 protein, partial [Candidatus Aenigmarchaeota archaeon]|nr:glycosyltransferase family 2 protein [Candidatus Aenigmarchaeota archaeon]